MAEEFGKLTLIVSDQPEQEFMLTQAMTTIGSADTNDIVIKRAKVSRVHARIECSEAGCTIFDLESAKGTLVNNQRVKQVNLASGDVIKLGDGELRFEALTAPASTDATIIDAAVFAEEVSEQEEETGSPPEEARDALVEVQPGGSNSPFFCIAARYSDVSLFGNLADYLGTDQPFYALQPPKPADGSPPLTKIEALAAQYIEEILSTQAKGPYRVGGFNIGGLIALEVAQQLQAKGDEVSLLALIDTPYLMNTPLPYWGYRYAQTVNRANRFLTRPWKKLFQSKVAEQAEKSVQEVRDALFDRVPQVIERLEEDYHTCQETLVDQGYEANLQVVQSYKPKTYPGKVALFLATQSLVRYSGALWYWHMMVPNGLDVYTVPGSYIGILKDPDVEILADQLKVCLAA